MSRKSYIAAGGKLMTDITKSIGEARERFRERHGGFPPKHYCMTESRAKALCWETASRVPQSIFRPMRPLGEIFQEYWEAAKAGSLYIYGVNVRIYLT